MNTHADKTQENKSQSGSSADSQMISNSQSTFQFVDNRPEAVTQRKLQEIANNSSQAKQAAQFKAMAVNYTNQQHQPYQRQENTPEQSKHAKLRWDKIQAELKKSGEFNTDETRANVKAYLKEHPEQANMVYSAGGAWLANQMNLKMKGERERIGPPEAYMGKKEDKSSANAKHLDKFAKGGHAFITDWAHKRVQGKAKKDDNFEGWGLDSNFIGTPSAAQKLVDKASEPGGYGLYQLEKSLGVPDGDWVKKSEEMDYAIWRYHVKNPNVFDLRMASGAESQAYSPSSKEEKFSEGSWVPKGVTLGGEDEAVINNLPREKFLKALDNKDIEFKLDISMMENTKREKIDQKRPWKQ